VTSGSPSRIIRCTMIRLLKAMVQVESRRRAVRARKISATPASPACVATRMCSTYLDLGAASYTRISPGSAMIQAQESDRTHLDLGPALDRLLERARHGPSGGVAGGAVAECLLVIMGRGRGQRAAWLNVRSLSGHDGLPAVGASKAISMGGSGALSEVRRKGCVLVRWE
jgi:hypothetical protein